MSPLFFIPALISFSTSILGLLSYVNYNLLGPQIMYSFFFIGDILVSGTIIFDSGHHCLLLTQLRRLGLLSKCFCSFAGVWSILSHLSPRIYVKCTLTRIVMSGAFLFLIATIPFIFEKRFAYRETNCHYPFGLGYITVFFFLVPAVSMLLFCIAGTMYVLRSRESNSDLVNSLSSSLYERLYVITITYTLSVLLGAPYYIIVGVTDDVEVPYACICLLALCSPFSGLVGTVYILISPSVDRMKRFNLYFVSDYYFRDSSTTNNRDEQEERSTQQTQSLHLRPVSEVTLNRKFSQDI